MKATSVTVRMYRQGFGDCFLLTFKAGTKVVSRVLIDCGLKWGDKVVGVEIEKVVDDIRKETGGKLDVLVATHEHWDHVSAFDPAKGYFDDFAIENVWVAWTEKATDKDAKVINTRLRKGAVALQLAAGALMKQASENGARLKADDERGKSTFAARAGFSGSVGKVAGFYGAFNTPLQGTALKDWLAGKPLKNVLLPEEKKTQGARKALVKTNTAAKQTPAFAAAKNPATDSGIVYKDKYSNLSVQTQLAMEHLLGLAKKKSAISYWYPGELDEESIPGIRFYILGPPKNAFLNKEDPSPGKDKETYLRMNTALDGFVDGVLDKFYTGADFEEKGAPFNNRTAQAFTSTEDAKQYAANSKPNKDSYHPDLFYQYYAAENDWRNIDHDWLDQAGALALQMDNDTNNTSLVLAIELIGSDKVLLFPGDAQVGSWLSWHELEWEVKNNGKKEKVTTPDLLKNTVFYKVGHHGSHNATVKKLGLDMMSHPELVAFVPEKQDQYNGILYEPLMDALNDKAKGRVIVSADDTAKAEDAVKKKPGNISATAWNKFKKNLKVTKLFVEYTVSA